MSSAVGQGPAVHRRRLRLELRRVREQAGLTQEGAAAQLDWSTSKIIRIESGSVGMSTTDLKALLGLYGVTDNQRVAELVDLARGARQRAWWSEYRDVLSTPLAQLVDLEAAASVIRNYEPLVIQGLLQTEDYARAVIEETASQRLEPERVDALVQFRLARQQRMFDREPLPELDFIIDEAALRRMVGGPDVMRAQLGHLAEMAKRDNVTVEVLPYAAGAHPGLRGPFAVLEFPAETDDEVLYLEGIQAEIVLRDSVQDTSEYLAVFDRLRGLALEPGTSISLINEVATGLS